MRNISYILFSIFVMFSCKGQEKQTEPYKTPSDSYILDSFIINIKSSKFKIIVLEKNKNKNKDIEHNSNLIIILKEHENNFFRIHSNSKLVFDDNTNCPNDGYNNIVTKNNYFTVEQNFCADFQFITAYITFKIDESTNEIFLHKYGQKHTDRSKPDRVIPDDIWTIKDFGKIKFEEFNERFMINLIQKRPKKQFEPCPKLKWQPRSFESYFFLALQCDRRKHLKGQMKKNFENKGYNGKLE